MSRETESAEHDLLKRAYRNFNARMIDQLLASLHPDVEWANGWEGGHVHGREAVRAYWTRQWEVLDPHVEPLAIDPGANGSHLVKVHQVVRNRQGDLLADTIVYHLFQLADGMIVRMDILPAAPQDTSIRPGGEG
jgi:hypothetical protein